LMIFWSDKSSHAVRSGKFPIAERYLHLSVP
jgi:hypothetical protein